LVIEVLNGRLPLLATGGTGALFVGTKDSNSGEGTVISGARDFELEAITSDDAGLIDFANGFSAGGIVF
jgi:hypothetical protein